MALGCCGAAVDVLQISAIWFGTCGIGEELRGTLLLIYMEHCCRTFECRREHLLITCLLTVFFSSGCMYSNILIFQLLVGQQLFNLGCV